MTPEQFTYWLQGFFEMADPKSLTEEQTAMVREHLKTVFHKVTPEPKSAAKLEPMPLSASGMTWSTMSARIC